MIKVIRVLSIGLCLVVLTSCVSVSRLDTASTNRITFVIDGRSFDDIWDAAHQSLTEDLTIVAENRLSGYIKATSEADVATVNAGEVVGIVINLMDVEAQRYWVAVVSEPLYQLEYMSRNWHLQVAWQMETTLGEPTASFIFEPDMALAGEPLRAAISAATGGEDRARFVDATPIATTLMGDSIATNPFMVDYACQMGALPISRAAIVKAIELNGVAIDLNKKAFEWGRLAAHDPDKVAQIVAEMASVAPESIAVKLEDVLAKRLEFLTEYQNAA
jgi:hypothetical protein